jgi:hypothetical protein
MSKRLWPALLKDLQGGKAGKNMLKSIGSAALVLGVAFAGTMARADGFYTDRQVILRMLGLGPEHS